MRLIWLLLFCQVSQARVFKINQEGFGTYFRLGGATTNAHRDAFSKSSNTSTVFADKQVTHALYGEFGAVVTLPGFALRFGFGGLQPAQVITTGSDSDGNKLFDLTSTINAPMGIFGIDAFFHQSERSRMFLSLEAGYVQFTLANAFVFTSAGQSALGVTDYIEDSSATLIAPAVAYNYEFLMFDTTTMTMELGYRQLQVSGLKYKGSGTGVNGTITSGAAVTNNDGGERAFDLSGLFLNLSFRFYIDI